MSKLVVCPDCARKVSKRADACPNCGCPIGAIIEAAPEPRADGEIMTPAANGSQLEGTVSSQAGSIQQPEVGGPPAQSTSPQQKAESSKNAGVSKTRTLVGVMILVSALAALWIIVGDRVRSPTKAQCEKAIEELYAAQGWRPHYDAYRVSSKESMEACLALSMTDFKCNKEPYKQCDGDLPIDDEIDHGSYCFMVTESGNEAAIDADCAFSDRRCERERLSWLDNPDSRGRNATRCEKLKLMWGVRDLDDRDSYFLLSPTLEMCVERRNAAAGRLTNVTDHCVATKYKYERDPPSGSGTELVNQAFAPGDDGKSPDETRALFLLEHACAKDDPAGCSLAKLALSEESLSARYEQYGSQLDLRRCTDGYPDSCFNASMEDALAPKEADSLRKRAFRLWEVGCSRGMGGMCTSVGILYRQGVGPISQDGSTAIRWFKRACKTGLSTGCIQIAAMYEDGEAVLPDSKKAAVWRQKACKFGHEASCRD